MLKDLIKARQKTGYLLPVIEEATILSNKKDSAGRRRDVFHPSEISGNYFCPRAWILGVHDPSLYEQVQHDTQTMWRFGVGTELHELVQNTLSEVDGVLFGTWKCSRWCKEKRCLHHGFKPDKSVCPLGTPQKAKWVYDEVAVIDDELRIRGKTDGILLLPEGKYVFEFKTTNSRTYGMLAEPLAAHIEQASWYIDILERSKHLENEILKRAELGEDISAELQAVRAPFKGIIIMYMNKDTQEFREFVIKSDVPLRIPDSITINGLEISGEESPLDEKKALLRETLGMLESGEIPPRLAVCTNKSCNRARKCFAKNACFSDEFPGGGLWENSLTEE